MGEGSQKFIPQITKLRFPSKGALDGKGKCWRVEAEGGKTKRRGNKKER